MVGQGNHVGPGFSLGLGEEHGHWQETLQDAMHLIRIIEGQHQEVLYAEEVVSQRPRTEDLAHDSHVLAVAGLKQTQPLQQGRDGWLASGIMSRRPQSTSQPSAAASSCTEK